MDKGLGFVDNGNVGKWVTIIYSTLMGLIVLGTSVNLSCVMESMSFASHLLGRGLLYIFIGTYYLNVTTGGMELAWEKLKADPPDDQSNFDYKRDVAAAFVAGLLVNIAGMTFVVLHIVPCFVGCCADREPNVQAHSVADMKDTSLKQDCRWLDVLLRVLTVCVGVVLLMASHKLWSTHFRGCVPIKKSQVDNYECNHELNKFTAVYFFDALYAGLFGITIIFAGLEWKFFIKHFGVLSRPLGKALYFLFVAVYFMGAGSPFAWKKFDQLFKTKWDQQLPFIAGTTLLGLGVTYGVLFFLPCIGGCCKDDRGGGKKKAKKPVHTVETANPTFDVET